MFVNSPYHANLQRFQGPTDTGEPCYPLSLGGESQTTTKPVEQRGFKSFNGKIDY